MQDFDKFKERIRQASFPDIFGQEKVKELVKSALLMKRHIILVGPPGVGKTTLVKNIAKYLPEQELATCNYHCDPQNPACPVCKEKKAKGLPIETKLYKGEELFIRVQGSPELTPEDFIGDIDPVKALEFGPQSPKSFTPGVIFKANKGILFFDEINRANEKVQNTLLQALEEGKVTIAGYDININVDFIVIGTMNPEDTSTEDLSEVFKDRFDFIYMYYPETKEIEKRIVANKGLTLKEISFSEKLLDFVVEFVRRLRAKDELERKPGVRATLGIYERAQGLAYVRGKDRVTIEDIKDTLISVLAHRIKLKPSIRYLKSNEEFLEEEFSKLYEEFSSKGDFP